MARRKVILEEGEIYHVFNRGIGGAEIFLGKREIERILELFDYYRFPQKIRFSQFKLLNKELKEKYLQQTKSNSLIVGLWAYAIMPDHYHLLIKQLKKDGIKRFVSNFQNAYAKYINLKKKRLGGLFLSPFKAKRIESDEILVHVSRYIHLNPVTAFMFDFNELKTSPLTSLPYYLKRKDSSSENMVDNSFLLRRFRGSKQYLKFVANQVDYQRKLDLIKKNLFE